MSAIILCEVSPIIVHYIIIISRINIEPHMMNNNSMITGLQKRT